MSPGAQISFYGGEALLRFPAVQYAVAYSREIFGKKPVSFRISSNGTTLTEPVLRWLDQNEDVSVTVTLNGFSHDTYRKYPDGRGSLHTIMQNIERIRSGHPGLWSRIDFLANVASLQELLDLRRFYMARIGKPPLQITGILEYGGNEIIHKIIHTSDTEKIRNEVHKLYCGNNDAYIRPYYHADVCGISARSVGRRVKVCRITACCMPFLGGLFVSAEGGFGFCERTGVWKNCGDMDTGIAMDNVHRLLGESLEIFNRRCRNCWCQRLCTICFKDFQAAPDGTVFLPEFLCREMQNGIENALELFCETGECNRTVIKML